MTALDSDLDRFVARLRPRLDAGAKTYGDSSLARPPSDLVDAVQQELEDVCGWSLLLWIRLDKVHRQVDQLRREGERT